tara:strand:+ start:1906 stop:2172 length:267 start_codon:yes stop_codon:yes gene_type:complete
MENQEMKFELLTVDQLEKLVDDFEETLFNAELDAEWQMEDIIEDFDVCDSAHWDQMKDLAVEMTHERYIGYGYTKEFVESLSDAYYSK